jgi:signal transduction histidine kinase
LQTSIGNLDEIIKDLNYILQLKAGGAHEKSEPIYLQQLVDAIKMSIGNIIETEKAEINCHFEGAESVVAIRSYLYSIFYNLILNSIKYKQQGIAPVINITSLKHNGETEVLFVDNGKGIDLGRHGKDIFGLYKRFDTKVEGKGMGLFMVKTQVENLGGKISVQSKVNRGTTFKLELPV